MFLKHKKYIVLQKKSCNCNFLSLEYLLSGEDNLIKVVVMKIISLVV